MVEPPFSTSSLPFFLDKILKFISLTAPYISLVPKKVERSADYMQGDPFLGYLSQNEIWLLSVKKVRLNFK